VSLEVWGEGVAVEDKDVDEEDKLPRDEEVLDAGTFGDGDAPESCAASLLRSATNVVDAAGHPWPGPLRF